MSVLTNRRAVELSGTVRNQGGSKNAMEPTSRTSAGRNVRNDVKANPLDWHGIRKTCIIAVEKVNTWRERLEPLPMMNSGWRLLYGDIPGICNKTSSRHDWREVFILIGEGGDRLERALVARLYKAGVRKCRSA
jgi:hypothetical protein